MATYKFHGKPAGIQFPVEAMGSEVYLRDGSGILTVYIPLTGESFELQPAQGKRIPVMFDRLLIEPHTTGDYTLEVGESHMIDNRGSLVITDALPPSRAQTTVVAPGDPDPNCPGTAYFVEIPDNPARRRIRVQTYAYSVGEDGYGHPDYLWLYPGRYDGSQLPAALLPPLAAWEADYSGPVTVYFPNAVQAVMVTEYSQ